MSDNSTPFRASVRGRGRGRGRGTSWRGRSNYTPQPWGRTRTPASAPIPADLGTVIETLPTESFRSSDNEPAIIRDAESIASFNWIDGVEEPTIAIPGAPARWNPPILDSKLKQDSGTYYRDLNAAHFPRHPFYAAVLAVLSNKDVSTARVDLMTCAATMRSLFEFARGERRTFRITVEVVGVTVFLTRRGLSRDEILPNVRGYGHTMPEAYTMWQADVTGSASHQRILRYRLAGLDCLVRYGSDGYLPDKLPADTGPQAPPTTTSASNDQSDQSDAAAALDSALHSALVSHSSPTHYDADIRVKQAGTRIPQSATFELKTRAAYRADEDFVAEYTPRLWLTQTPFFVLGLHTYGVFNDVRVRDVRGEVAAWENANQHHLLRFAEVLRWLVRRAREQPGGAFELWRHESGDLEVRTPGGGVYGGLPADVKGRWTGGAGDNDAV